MSRPTLDDLRRFAVARSFFTPTTLARAIETLGFVQADPIRAPARAQDLTLRHRVTNYRAGDLERDYERLDIEEDVLVNYGFLPAAVQRLMHPRGRSVASTLPKTKRAREILEFVRARATVHPREVDDHFAHGAVVNYWGGSSSATTHALDDLHYRGLLRIVRRERGIRVYAARTYDPGPLDVAARDARIDALVDVVVNKYAPLPGPSLSRLVSRLRYAVPHWRGELKQALQRAKLRLSYARVNEMDWYWPSRELIPAGAPQDAVRLLAPFDPVTWDRDRFEIFWGWAYRFEAYTPVAKRKLGYYALPLLWRDRVIGWGNLSVVDGALQHDVGYVKAKPREPAFTRELDAEVDRMRRFLALDRTVMR